MLFPECLTTQGAKFSEDKRYRYALWRIWNPNLPSLGFCLLNPSKADAESDDPTILRLSRRARQLGFGGLHVVNIFAWRSTAPEALYSVAEPVGRDNDTHIIEELRLCSMTICGWGKHGNYLGRGRYVENMLRSERLEPFALSVNGDGTPEHPLYLPYSLKPQLYNSQGVCSA